MRSFSLLKSVGVLLVLSAFTTISAQNTGTVTLQWEPSVSTGITDYKISYGTVSQLYVHTISVGKVDHYTISGLSPGTTYYFAAIAINESGVESPYSNEVPYTVPIATGSPAISIAIQGDCARFGSPATIPLSADVVPNGHHINKVEFYSGLALLAEIVAPPYRYTWSNVCSGTFELTARLVFDTSRTVDSKAALITVANSAPTFRIGGLANCYSSEAAALRDIQAKTWATDSCDSPVTLTVTQGPGVGTCMVNYRISATDARGAVARRDLAVTVDGIAPLITIAPLNDSYSSESDAFADIQAKATVTDNCTTGITPVVTLKPGSSSATLTFTVRAADACGNSASLDVTVAYRPLIAQFELSEGSGTTTADTGPFGFTGKLVNGTSWAPGVVGNAIRFDGTTGYVAVDHQESLSFGPDLSFSLEAWVKTANTQASMQVLTKSASFGKAGFYLFLFSDGHPAVRLHDTDSESTGYIRHTLGPSLNDGKWHHVVVVIDRAKQQLTMYADGVPNTPSGLEGVGGNKIGDLSNTAPLLISGAWYPFEGSIDQVRIHRHALSNAEVLASFNARK